MTTPVTILYFKKALLVECVVEHLRPRPLVVHPAFLGLVISLIPAAVRCVLSPRRQSAKKDSIQRTKEKKIINILHPRKPSKLPHRPRHRRGALGSSPKRSHRVQPLSNTPSLLQLGLKPRAAAGTYLKTLTVTDTFIRQTGHPLAVSFRAQSMQENMCPHGTKTASSFASMQTLHFSSSSALALFDASA